MAVLSSWVATAMPVVLDVRRNRGMELAGDLPLSGKRVVLIDDSNTIRRSGEIFLSQAGCQVVLSEDGFDGLNKVVEHRPDLVFVDVIMPRLDGYQTCTLIRSHPAFSDLPIVMLTSKDALFDRARARLAGAQQYLLKPFTKNSLVDAVATHACHAPEHGAGSAG